MADFRYVPCPKCGQQFMVGVEFFHLPEAYCHCPYCHHEFPVGVAAQRPPAEAGASLAGGARRSGETNPPA